MLLKPQLLRKLDIEPCYIEKRQSWQNLIEAQFKIQLRLADAKFEQASTLSEIQEQHAAYIEVFNTTNHWAHRNREDGRKTPAAVLGWQQGRVLDPNTLRSAFRHLQFPRIVNQHGLVSVQRFYIFAHRGLAKQRVAVWIYEDRLHIEHQQTVSARYKATLDRRRKSLKSVSRPIPPLLSPRNWSYLSWTKNSGAGRGCAHRMFTANLKIPWRDNFPYLAWNSWFGCFLSSHLLQDSSNTRLASVYLRLAPALGTSPRARQNHS